MQDDKEFLKVKNEIINSLMDFLKKKHGDASKPGIGAVPNLIDSTVAQIYNYDEGNFLI